MNSTLETLPLGARAQVASLQGGHGFLRRVHELGLEVGLIIRKERQEETGPILIRSGAHTFAVGRGIARRILVEELHDQQ